MTEADEKLALEWQNIYQDLYQKAPGGFLEQLDPQIVDLSAEERRVVMVFRTKPWMENPRHTVHGGVIASMADTAMGMMTRILADSALGGPTISLSVNYIRAVPIDADVYVRATTQKCGKQIIFTTCEGYLADAPEEILFTGQCTNVPGREKVRRSQT